MKIRRVEHRYFLFADAHSPRDLQTLMDCFSSACYEFGLTISLKRTQIFTQNAPEFLVISIAGQALDNV